MGSLQVSHGRWAASTLKRGKHIVGAITPGEGFGIPGNTLLAVGGLLEVECEVEEELGNLLVGIVNAQLLKRVLLWAGAVRGLE
jgi:hypothetical protein